MTKCSCTCSDETSVHIDAEDVRNSEKTPVNLTEVIESIDRAYDGLIRLRDAKREVKKQHPSDKVWVYVAGPYTKPDPVINTRRAIRLGRYFESYGLFPIVPHLSHLAHLIEPQGYEEYMKHDLELITRCDALYRMPGESPGADREVTHAQLVCDKVFADPFDKHYYPNHVVDYYRAVGRITFRGPVFKFSD